MYEIEGSRSLFVDPQVLLRALKLLYRWATEREHSQQYKPEEQSQDSRKMIGHAVTRILTATCAACCLLVSDPSWADIGLDTSANRLRPCASDRNCVSSNYLEPPNRYLSPLRLVNDREKSFQRAVRDLNQADVSIAEVKPERYYIHLTVTGTAPSSLDDIELIFTEKGIVNVRCDARVTLPIPPFCLKRNLYQWKHGPAESRGESRSHT